MAENGWYEKHKKDIAAALKKGKTAPKDAAVACTLVKTVDGAHLLCAHVSNSKAAELVKEARKAGGKVISAGRLYLGDDGVTFELDSGDLGVKVKVATASMLVGVPLNVTVKQAEGAAVPAVPPTQQAVVAPPPGPVASVAPAAPPTPAGAALIQAALAKMVPAIQQAAKNHPERKNDLLQPLARCKQQIKDNQAPEAKATLFEIGRLVKELSRPADVPAAQAPPAETGAEPDKFQESYNGLLETVPGDLQRLRTVDAAAAAKVKMVVDGAAAQAGKGNFQQAFSLLNRAAEVLAKMAGAARARAAAEAIPEGKVAAMKAALSQAQSKWGAAVAVARARLKPVQAALREDFPSAAVGVNNILDSYEQDLLAELRAGQAKADEDGLAAAVRGTLEKVRSLRAEAAGDKVFSYLEKCGVPVKAAFAEAFDEVESLLQV